MSKIKGKVVLLPTTNKTPIQLGVNFHYNVPGVMRGTYLEMYIISNEEIKEGDWAIHTSKKQNHKLFLANTIHKSDIISDSGGLGNIIYCKKVICSTDPNLNLPPIPQEFIKSYCENPVEDVWVEFREILGDEGIIKTAFGESDLIPIITPIQVKESWTRDEVVQLIIQSHIARNVMTDYYNELPIWIDKNLQ